MDWLSAITEWLKTLFINIFNSLIDFLNDLWLDIAESVLNALAGTISSIPTPGFLESISLGSLISLLPSDVLYFVGFLELSRAFGLISAGVAFRLARKLVTLFQW